MADALSTMTGRPIWQRGIIAAVLGSIAAVVVFLVANAAISGSIQVPKTMGSKTLVDLKVGQLIGACVISLVIGTLIAMYMHPPQRVRHFPVIGDFLGGPVMSRLTRRRGLRSRQVPGFLAILTLLSLASPLTISGATAGTKVSLAVMHIVVGAIAIVLLGPASADRSRA